jgi:hypothetical protein
MIGGKQYYECTDYPKIYRNVYWGAFRTDSSGERPQSITDNRNRFIVDYGIKKYKALNSKLESIQQKETVYMDHVERYATNDGFIIVTSPYNHINPEDYEKAGWTQIYPLYHENAITFIKILNHKYHLMKTQL